jgi:hypothetical protein
VDCAESSQRLVVLEGRELPMVLPVVVGQDLPTGQVAQVERQVLVLLHLGVVDLVVLVGQQQVAHQEGVEFTTVVLVPTVVVEAAVEVLPLEGFLLQALTQALVALEQALALCG